MVTSRPPSCSAIPRRKPAQSRPRRRPHQPRGRRCRPCGPKRLRIPPLAEYLGKVEDPRSRQGRRHSLVSVLTLLVAGILCQQKGYVPIAHWARGCPREFKRRLGFIKRDTPAPSTFHEILKGLCWEGFEKQVRTWTVALLAALAAAGEPADRRIAIDGKHLKGSGRKEADIAHMLTAVTHGLALVLGHQAVKKEQGELTVSTDLLEKVLFQGCILTADAQFTQRSVVEQVQEKGGDYLLMVRGNQPKLLAQIQKLLEPCGVDGDKRRRAVQRETKRGRIVERRMVAVDVNADELGWPGAKQAFLLRHTCYNPQTKRESDTILYGVTSLGPEEAGVEDLLQIRRGHWMIEVASHWVRDVVLGEDASQVASGSIAMLMAICRGAAITLLKAIGYDGVAQGKRAMNSDRRRVLAAMGI